MSHELIEEIKEHLEETLSSHVVALKTDRYLLGSGSRPRIEAVRKEISTYLKLRHRKDSGEVKEIIKQFDESLSTKRSKAVDPELSEMMSKFRPAISVRDVKTAFLVDAETFERSDLDIGFYSQFLKKKGSDIFDEAVYMDPIYNPRMAEPYYATKVGSVPCLAINSYLKPHWMKVGSATPTIPTLFKGLIDHLIVNEEAKEYFYDWLYKSLTDRAYTFLVLCGQKGIGKGQLQKLIRALHGAENFVEGKRGTIGGQFNSQLQDSRMVWFDEIHYDKPDVNNMKRMLNDLVSIEKKGIDATKSTHIHCSIVLSNNDLTDNYIELDDRRFSPLELTEEKLTTKFDPAWFDEFNRHVDDLADKSELVAQFGAWILEHGKSEKYGRQEPYKGEKFNQIVVSSLRKWQDDTVEMLTNPNTIDSLLSGNNYTTYDKLRKWHELNFKESGIYPKKNKVMEFIRAYTDVETDMKLASVVKVGRDFHIIPEGMGDDYRDGFVEVGKMRLDI